MLVSGSVKAPAAGVAGPAQPTAGVGKLFNARAIFKNSHFYWAA